MTMMNTFNKTFLVILLALSVAPLCAQQSYLNGAQLQYACDSSSATEGKPDTSNYTQFKYSVGLSWFSSFNGVSLKFNLNNHL